MSYALGFAAVAALAGSAQAAPPVASPAKVTAADVISAAGIPVADTSSAAIAETAAAPMPSVAIFQGDESSLIISGDAADLLIASNSLTVLATSHDVTYIDGHIVITIPNKYLNNASKILDLVNTEVVTLGELVREFSEVLF